MDGEDTGGSISRRLMMYLFHYSGFEFDTSLIGRCVDGYIGGVASMLLPFHPARYM